jgi:hypothetical protein
MDRIQYNKECATRWDREALQNAMANWSLFQEHRMDLVAILQPYLKDSGCRDLSGKYQNPNHTLTDWLWTCSAAPGNHWIWDFCAHYQTCHLARGIIPYCKQLIAELQHPDRDGSASPHQPSLPLHSQPSTLNSQPLP